MWSKEHIQEARRACEYQIEQISARLKAEIPPSEAEQGRLEVTLREWQTVQRAAESTLPFIEAGRQQEIEPLLSVLRDHLKCLSDRAEWPRDWDV